MKIGRIACYLFLMMVVVGALLLHTSVLAQEETIELRATYPRLESTATEATFKFPVSLIYRGGQAREFDLRTIGPLGWSTYVTSEEPVQMSYSWRERESYEIRVKVKDEHGLESDWSDPMSLRIPKYQSFLPLSWQHQGVLYRLFVYHSFFR